MHLVIYISSLMRCVVALHDLVKNKLQFKDDDPWTEKDEKEKGKEKKGKEAKEETKSSKVAGEEDGAAADKKE